MKYLCLGIIPAIALSAMASSPCGSYLNFNTGYSQTNGRIDGYYVPIKKEFFLPQGEKKGHGFFGSFVIGHAIPCKKGYLSGEVTLSYDSSRSQIFYFEETGRTIKGNYRPRIGLGVSVKGGIPITETVTGFLRLGISYHFADAPGYVKKPGLSIFESPNCKTWSYIPGIGVQYYWNEKISWNTELHYRIPFSIKVQKDGFKFKEKPDSVVATVGMIYHI